jgi:hypothetical protein
VSKIYKENEFYIRKTLEYGWTRNVLIHQIEAGAHLEIDAKKCSTSRKFFLNILPSKQIKH